MRRQVLTLTGWSLPSIVALPSPDMSWSRFTRTTTVAPDAGIPPLSQAIACSQMAVNASAWIIATERRSASGASGSVAVIRD